MACVTDVLRYLESIAPPGRKMDFDNVGLLAGRGGAQVRRILTALDITDAVIDEAARADAQLIVSHHPMFFTLKSVTDAEPAGERVLRLLEHHLAAICMHTNLDAAEGGVNDALAAALGLENVRVLSEDGLGRYGTLREPMAFADFLAFVKETLGCGGLRYVRCGGTVSRVAVMGGSGGGDYALALAKGCDTYVTADVKYNVFLDCREAGLNLVDAGHFNTENPVIPVLADGLRRAFGKVEVLVSEVHGQTEQFY